jgi:RHS repeat-associated protein
MREKNPGIGITSAISPGAAGDTFTETRGDGPTRSFTYTHMFTCHGEECGRCSVYEFDPPQQMLTNYTDFEGHATTLGYDANWYINSVRDANNHTTTYARGPAPPAGIGQILTITHPGGAHIGYTYYDHGHYLQQITNERGATTYHFRDANHRITRTDYKDASGNLIANETFSYNSFGQVLTHRLKNGAYQHFQYDSRGLLLAKTNPTTTADWQTALNSPAKTTYSYWTNWVWADRVFSVTRPRNGSSQTAWERYEYDRNAAGNAVPGRGLVTKITYADSTWQSFGYSQFGNKLWEENELRQRTSYTYDNYNRVLTVTKPLVGAETFGYLKPNTGSPYLHTTNSIYTHTSRAGIVTTNSYDPDWRKTSTTTAGARTQCAYDYVGNLTDITDPRNKVTHNGYDNRNRKTSTTEAYGITGLATTTVWHYDPASNINRIDRPDSVTETKGYDALNRVIWHTVPKQVPGQNPINLTTHINYNPSGTINWIRDAKNHTTTFAYNASDERIAMTYPGGGGTQSWVYDDAHNLTSRTTVRGAPETQRFTYDLRNRKVGMTWDNGADSASFSYDDASRLLTANNPNSSVTRVYDAAGRLTRDQQAVTGLGPKNLTYPLYDDDGRLKRVNLAGIYDYSFGYDSMGRFETITPTGGSVSFKYYYDNASNETMRHNYLNNVDQIYTPDSLNRMAERYVKKGATTHSHEVYKYDRMSRLTEVSRSEDSKKDVFGYYWTGELHTARYGLDLDAPIQEGGDPDMDSTDNVDPWAGYQPPETSEAEPTPPPDDSLPPDSTVNTAPSAVFTPSDTPPAEDPTKGQKTAEDYVADGNLGPAGAGQPDTPTSRSVTYNLDKAGNRTSVIDDVNGNATYVPNVLNQYTSVRGSSVGNGGEHEIQTYNNVGYTYLNDERLMTVKTPPANPTYTYNLYYDALGRCVKRTLNGVATYYIYDGEKPILEYRSTDLSNPARNVYGKGIDEILMRYDPSFNPARTFYYQHDHEGSVTHLTNTSGNVVENYRYDAFGAPAIYDGANPPNQLSSSAYSNRFLFTGREYANLFGFYEYRARAYHPTLGRFMSEDPKLFVRRAGLGAAPTDWTFAAHPDEAEFNLFRYCGNDPIDFTDPMGLMTDGLVAEPEGRDVAPAVVLGHAAILGILAAPAAEAAVGRAAVAAISRSPTVARVAAAIGAAFKGEQARNSSSSSVAKTIANPVPSTMARVIPERIPATTLGRPGAADVLVTAAKDIAGKNASQIANRLGIPQSPTGFKVFEFSTPQSGVASPVFRTDPGFIGGGLTSGGAREFVIPNGPIPPGAIIRTVP